METLETLTPPRTRRDGGGLALIMLVSLLGALVLGYLTASPMGVNTDSTDFLSAGENLAAGRGLVVPNGAGGLSPLTHFPPLVSLMIAGGIKLGLDPVQAGRIINLIFFAGAVLMTGLIVRRYSASRWTGAIAALFLVFALDMLAPSMVVATEPPFYFFLALGFWLLGRHFERRSTGVLIAAGLAAALAMLSRYPGAVLIASGGIAIIGWGPGTFTRRIRDAAVFGTAACLPVAVALIRNLVAAGTLTNRTFNVHPVPGYQIKLGLHSLARFFMAETVSDQFGQWFGSPPPLPLRRDVLLIVALGGGLAITALALWRGRAQAQPAQSPEPAALPNPLPMAQLLLVFIGLYVTFIVISHTFFDAAVQFDGRMFSPIYAPIVIMLAVLADRALAAVRWRGVLAWGIGAATVLLLTLQVMGGTLWCLYHRNDPNLKLYAMPEMRDSAIINYIRALPPQQLLVVNDTMMVYFLADGRLSAEPPEKWNFNSHLKNAVYDQEMLALKRRIANEPHTIVYFSGYGFRIDLPTPEELEQQLGVRPVWQGDDGVVYRLPAAATAPAAEPLQ